MPAQRMRMVALVLCAVAGAGCNQVLGIDAAKLDPSVGASSLQCVLNSDCADEDVCIFRVCSAPCARDRDCSGGLACLATKRGNACVDPKRSACTSDDPCPSGTACTDGACRTQCDEGVANACLAGQTCVNGGCRGAEAGDAGTRTDGGVQELGAGRDAGSKPATAPPDSGIASDSGMPVTSHQPTLQRECDSGEKHCMDTLLLTCRSDGQWNDGTQCAYACANGACTGECVPDDQQCHDSTLRHCDQNGEWREIMTCPKVCTATGCVDKCVAGSHQCSDLDLLTCTNAGEFVFDETCHYVCKSGACVGECVPDDTRCDDGVQETCDADGHWGSEATCEFVCAGNVCGGECVPDDTQCTDGTHVKTCDKNGMWGDPAACPYVCDTNTDDCGGSCAPDTYSCNNTAPSTSQSLFCNNGTPMLDDGCSYPSELCDAGTGKCATNSLYDVGFTAMLPNSSSLSANIMIGNPVTLAKRATLLHFGLYGRAKMGTKVKMVLYADDGSGASSSPSTFITSSDEADLVDGTMLLPLQIAATLNPGKYWVMAVYNGTGGNTHVTSSGGTGRSFYTSQDYLTSFPATYPSTGVTKLSNYDCNHFLEVRNSL